MKPFRAAFLVLAVFAMTLAIAPAGEPRGKSEKERKPRFTVGKETTVVDSPRDSDGRIDYATALNQRLCKGVTPDNNANVLLWKAFGPHPEGAKMPAAFFQWMGVPAPAEKGEYFINLGGYVFEYLSGNAQDVEEQFERLDRANRRAWKAKQHSGIAGWLKTNEKSLATVVEATKRSHYYSPLVMAKTDKGSARLLNALLPGVQTSR